MDDKASTTMSIRNTPIEIDLEESWRLGLLGDENPMRRSTSSTEVWGLRGHRGHSQNLISINTSSLHNDPGRAAYRIKNNSIPSEQDIIRDIGHWNLESSNSMMSSTLFEQLQKSAYQILCLHK